MGRGVVDFVFGVGVTGWGKEVLLVEMEMEGTDID